MTVRANETPILYALREDEDMNLGRAAYDGYRVASDGRSKVSGAALPEWEDQAPEIRECWRAAADCVVMVLELRDSPAELQRLRAIERRATELRDAGTENGVAREYRHAARFILGQLGPDDLS